MSALFVTGSGTGVGKTLVTASIARQLKDYGRDFIALKPVITGYGGGESDTSILASLQDECGVDVISPWRFADAISPNMAAEKEGRVINPKDLVAFCKKAIAGHDATIIEGIGGAFVPLAKTYTVADWIKDLGIPAAVVTGTYLGAVSHTVSTLEALKAKGVPVTTLVVSQSEDEPVPLDMTVETLRGEFPEIPIATIQRINQPDPWRHTSDLTFLLG